MSVYTNQLTDRRGFMRATALSAAAATMRRALGQPQPCDCDDPAIKGLKYPRAQCVGVQCECALWLTRYTNCQEHSGDVNEWTIEDIYTKPLIASGKNGLLHKIVHTRVGQAVGSMNSENRRIITVNKKKKVRDAIDDFDNKGSSTDKAKSIADLMLEGKYYYPPMNVPETDYLLVLLQQLHDSGIYFPSNHVGVSDDDKNTIKDLLETGRLWDYKMPYLVGTGTEKRLGDMTFHNMFHTRLQDVYRNYNDTFEALKDAKRVGILVAHKDRQLTVYPDTDAELSNPEYEAKFVPNNRCCDVQGTGQCCDQFVAGKYCSAISGTDPHCNSLSDPCTDPCP